MATNVILPALGMAQDTGKIVRWLKAEGEQVKQGEPLVEVETDKATVEIEALASGVLTHVVAREGDDVPVGQVIATILAPDETGPKNEILAKAMPAAAVSPEPSAKKISSASQSHLNGATAPNQPMTVIAASPLAARMAEAHNLNLNLVRTNGKRVQKADVLAYLQSQDQGIVVPTAPLLASPKARRLAKEQGKNLALISGSGPGGAVLAADVLAAPASTTEPRIAEPESVSMSTIWRIMAERTTQSWTSVPHFYLTREINASRLIFWREQLLFANRSNITYTDLLVKIVAAALRQHPRLNASWKQGNITLNAAINIGLAVALEEGLVVPVLRHADQLGLNEMASQREELVTKARNSKLRPQDISDGTFTISNLGMYGVDAFNAIINQPQAAILAVGRIVERVVPLHGQPAVQPMMVLTLSCDHRVVDGARGAQFLDTLAALIEEPLGLLD
ncbi:MAG TPA: 2-oxo acid dehydrogenase subunit E2 [Ktedonobacteraceae bacterium]|nr:2-oxo acid dehydrogenase subunit E2 [Ktedonobacteraceae bacterium]